MKEFCLFFVAVIVMLAAGCDGGERAVAKDPRFAQITDEVIVDKETGLMWTRNTNAPGPDECAPGAKRKWQDAQKYIACLNDEDNKYLGYNDWRLPAIEELENLIHLSRANTVNWLQTQGFSNVQLGWYWSATSENSYAWIAHMDYGYAFQDNKDYEHHVWPVRKLN